jgi:uncharacterized lipoprotein YmbA
MLLNLLRRDEDTGAAVARIVDAATTDRVVRRRLLLQAVRMAKSLVKAGVVVRREQPTSGGRRYDLAADLQDDFALNQPLSAFALAAFDLLDVESPTFALDVVSVIEATLEDPMTVLLAQQHRARGVRVAELKADGVEYDERMRLLDEVTWPKPLDELLTGALTIFAQTHPWIADADLSPKSIVRDMYERAMTFGEFIAFYKVQRSEGLVLRYLSDAYRALRQTVPETLRTPELADLIEWLGEIVRMTDSSLLDEWDELVHPTRPQEEARALAAVKAHPMTGNERAFTVLIRNAMFRRVTLAADDDVEGLADLEDDSNRVWAAAHPGFDGDEWTGDDWDTALGDYWDEHASIGLDAAARGPSLLVIDKSTTPWPVRQIIADPADNRDWSIRAEVDTAASDDAERLVLREIGFGRLD